MDSKAYGAEVWTSEAGGAQQVFEIGFEGITRSTRHKSGLALRFPRILRWRQDVGANDADRLAHFETLMRDSHAV